MATRDSGFHVGYEKLSELVDGLSGERYAVPVKRGHMTIGLYDPRGQDDQGPHERDEIYIIAAGTGLFHCGAGKTSFKPGDALFVPAKIAHKFEDFTDDFSAWVIFYGPEGGDEPGFYEVDSNLVNELN